MYRTFLSCLLALIALLTGCHNAQKDPPSELSAWLQEKERIRVLCTTQMIQDIVQNIGGPYVNSIALIKGELDPHSYELVKGDDEKFAAADLIFYNGLGLEHGPSLHQQLATRQNALSVGDWVLDKEPSQILYVDGQIDPHIWLDGSMWAQIVEPIVHALSAQKPQFRDDFEQNGRTVLQKMLGAHEAAYTILQAVPSQWRFLVTSHDAFNYFTRAYLATPEERNSGDWKKRFRAPEGLAPEGQLGASDIQHILNHLLRYRIHVIFPESNVSKDSLRKIVVSAKDKGLTVQISDTVLYGDAMGPKGSPGGSYTGMLQWNAQTIADHLMLAEKSKDEDNSK